MENITQTSVSVIVPVYNTEAYLCKCLDSLVNQTLKNMEIIVINDGSPDNSQDIIDGFVQKYPKRVRCFSKENGGLSDARNYGVKQAKGEWIGFVDSDDYVEIDMFETLYTKAIKDKCDMVDCSYYEVNGDKKKEMGYFPESFTQHEYISAGIVCIPTKLIKRDLILSSGEMPRIWHEDMAWTPVVSSFAQKIGFVNRPLYNYVQRDGSISNSFHNKKILDMNKAVDFALENSNPDFRDEVIIKLLRILERNVYFRWYFADAFINKIKDLCMQVNKTKLYLYDRNLFYRTRKYTKLTEKPMKKILYLNGFNNNDVVQQKQNVEELGFYDKFDIYILNENNCDVNCNILKKCTQNNDWDVIAIYFALTKIIENGGIYLGTHMIVDAPFNFLRYFDAFFAKSSNTEFTLEIFGGLSGNEICKEILNRLNKSLLNDSIVDFQGIICDTLKHLYGINAAETTGLFIQNSIAILKPETAYFQMDMGDCTGENALHFCHKEPEYMPQNNDIILNREVYNYLCTQYTNAIKLQSINNILSRQLNWKNSQYNAIANSNIWIKTKFLRIALDGIKRKRNGIYHNYHRRLKEKTALEKKYAIPKELLENYSKKDCIEDYRVLIDFCTELEAEGYSSQCPLYLYDPGAYYGIQKDLMTYAGIDYQTKQIRDFGLIEHGAHFQDIAPMGGEGKEFYTGYITYGKFRKNYLNRRFGLPTFAVGPYIEYSKNYYTDEKLHKLKLEYGKTLLIFYDHNHEWLHREYQKDDFLQYVKNLKASFDTILFCGYWLDLKEDYINDFADIGCKIVSCGFRSDENFMQRQKTLLTLADYVLTNGVGSHIGYSVYMKKPVSFYKSPLLQVTSKENLSTTALQLIEVNKQVIAERFYMNNGQLNLEITEAQRTICEPYFGFKCVKTPEEMKIIFEILEEIYFKKNKNNSYQKIIADMLSELPGKNEAYMSKKHKILEEAINMM